jgi:hypothetical protein
MAVIGFRSGSVWLKARWAVSRFLEDVIASHPEDRLLCFKLEQAMALDGLHLDLQEEAFAERILAALKYVAQATVEGRLGVCVRGKVLEPEDQRQYVESVTELLELINREEAG